MQFSVALLVFGLVLVVVGSLVQIVRAFQQSIWWGIAYLLLPAANLAFMICHWARAKGSLCCVLIGVALIGLGAVVDGKAVSAKSLYGALTSSNDGKEAENLNASIDGLRARIETLEDQFQGGGAELAKQFQVLDQRRKELKVMDPAEVQRFNVEAEAYTAQNNAQKAIGVELESARQKLSGLLDERARLRAANPPIPAQYASASNGATDPAPATTGANGKQVVMYTTARCPACVAAKRYLGQRGVQYEERDVERSAEARKEFQSFGARGVPLIVVGNERMEGFNAQRFEQMIGG